MKAALQACGAVPSGRQLRWHADNVIGLFSLSINTYTGAEWGYGNEAVTLFNPTEFDARQIVAAGQAAGLKLLMLVAKHHNGFCLWPSHLNDGYSVKNSPWRAGQGDMIREMVDACRAVGMKVGIYLSPWDRNHPEYGLPGYVDYYHGQLRELLTDYGPLHEVWFDGANGGDGWYGGAGGVRQIGPDYYQWPKVLAMVRALQPQAVCFGLEDIRWVGNEMGAAGDPCWATMGPKGTNGPGAGNQGVRGGAVWMPAESDFPLRDGWFWHPGGVVKTAGDLVNRYFTSVGRNSVMNIGIAPDRQGRICAEDAQALEGFGARIRAIFATNLATSAHIVASQTRLGFTVGNLIDGNDQTCWASADGELQPEVTVDFGRACTFSVVRIREAIRFGQRVDEWALDQWADGRWQEFYKSSGIGAERLWRGGPVTTVKIRLRILRSAAPPVLSEFGVYLEPEWSRKEAGHSLGFKMDHGIDKSQWRIVFASSEGAPAANAIDGNITTFWHTRPGNGSLAAPQELVVDMGLSHAVTGFLYLPRQDHCPVGNVSRYAFYLSADGKFWGEPVAQGEFGNIKANAVQQKVTLAQPKRGRYLKFIALSVADGSYVAVAEIGVIAEDV